MFGNIGIFIKEKPSYEVDWTKEKGVEQFCSQFNTDNVNGLCGALLRECSKGKMLEALIIKDNNLTNSLNEEIDKKTEYLLEIDDLNDEIKKLNEEREDKEKEYYKRICELAEKSERNELTEEEKQEMLTLQQYIFEPDAKLSDKQAKLNTIKSSAYNGDLKSDIAMGYADKTYSLNEELKNAKFDEAQNAADKLVFSAKEYARYENQFSN